MMLISAASGSVYFTAQSVFFNTQMHEPAAYTFPNISPLMQRAVTFPHNPGGGVDSLMFLTQRLLEMSVPVFVKGERAEKQNQSSSPQREGGLTLTWRYCFMTPCTPGCIMHEIIFQL